MNNVQFVPSKLAPGSSSTLTTWHYEPSLIPKSVRPLALQVKIPGSPYSIEQPLSVPVPLSGKSSPRGRTHRWCRTPCKHYRTLKRGTCREACRSSAGLSRLPCSIVWRTPHCLVAFGHFDDKPALRAFLDCIRDLGLGFRVGCGSWTVLIPVQTDPGAGIGSWAAMNLDSRAALPIRLKIEFNASPGYSVEQSSVSSSSASSAIMASTRLPVEGEVSETSKSPAGWEDIAKSCPCPQAGVS